MIKGGERPAVAIVTCTHVYNYGNSLQNYALQKVVELYGYKAETMITDFVPAKRVLKYKVKACIKFLQRKKDNAEKRKEIFRKFEKEFLCFSKYKNIYKSNEKVTKKYSYFIAGSDQIWNPSWYDEKKKSAFLLNFVTDNGKKIAYAPSFGVKELFPEWVEWFKTNLKSFARLSVREKEGAKIIKELIGENVPVLLDPTLLLGKKEWEKMQVKPAIVAEDEKYILVYFLGGVDSIIEKQIADLSKDKKLKVINILKCDSFLANQVGPLEFLYLINNASLVMTDSFHACVFSFIFQKPFLVYPRLGIEKNMFGRIKTLLDTFGLERKIVTGNISIDIFENDYLQGMEIWKREREKALQFIEEVLCK